MKFLILIGIFVGAFKSVPFDLYPAAIEYFSFCFGAIVVIALSGCLTSRRYHDLNREYTWFELPLVGDKCSVFELVLVPGNPEENQFGHPPNF